MENAILVHNLTREEACKLFKINPTTLWHWTKKGKIIAYGIGYRVYYKRGELMESLIRINYLYM